MGMYMLISAAEEEGAKDAVQLPGHLLGLLGGLEERIEVIGVCELVWQQEVEQRPQLVQVVLQRRAREQQAPGGGGHELDVSAQEEQKSEAVRAVDFAEEEVAYSA
eukprot:825226-Rhodomonas_salina.1